MKKLLVVALVAVSVVGLADARCGRNSCAPVACEKRSSCCIPAPRVIDCVSNMCEGAMPDICGVVPAPRNVIKHIDTQITYSCAPLEGCAVPATAEQVEMFRANGSVRETTCHQ